jgi:hypothetical protein
MVILRDQKHSDDKGHYDGQNHLDDLQPYSQDQYKTTSLVVKTSLNFKVSRSV